MTQTPPNSIIRDISVTAEITAKELEPCNSINVLYIPSGVTAFISFVRSPKESELYPLYANSNLDLTLNGIHSSPQSIYLFTTGTHLTEKVKLNINAIGTNRPNLVITKNPDEVGIVESVVARLEPLDPIEFNPPSIYMVQTTQSSAQTILNIGWSSANFDRMKVYIRRTSSANTGYLQVYWDGTDGAEVIVGWGSTVGDYSPVEFDFLIPRGISIAIKATSTNATPTLAHVELYQRKA